MEVTKNQTITTTASAQENQIQEQFYDNISSGGVRPTIVAIIIISIWLILEMGTFLGFLIPADLLLYTSWLILWANHRWWSAIFMFSFAVIATVIGDLLWYYWSSKVGSAFYTRPDTRYFKKKHLYSAQAAMEKYGDKVFYIGKFLHIRSFLPMLAGIGRMNIVRFWLNSVLSTLIRAGATFIPSFIIGVLFPSIMGTWWMLVIGFMIFIGTEAVARVFVFNKELKHVAQRLRNSHDQFAAIKDNIIQIKENISEVTEYVIKGDNNNKEWTVNNKEQNTK